jgi:hypothetical protein
MPTTIQVSDRRFLTDPDTWIGESAFFKALFSGKWGDPQDDGSYFIDADPDLFEHILRYLRRGVLPVFYDRAKGHDYVLYGALLEEARSFGIDRLEKWLNEQKYLEVVNVAYSVTETDNSNTPARTVDGSVEIAYDLVRKRVSVWYCPEGRYNHDSKYDCRFCESTGLNSGYRYEDAVRWAVTQKRTTFNHQLCIQGR